MSEDTPRLTVPVSDQDHVQGSPSAPITLVEYGDYECPHCGRAFPVVKAVQKRLGKRLRFVFRNMPLSQMHPHAELAAEAAEAAGAQGKFWEMHDALYENQGRLSPGVVEELAAQMDLDLNKFNGDLRGGSFREHVRADFKSAVRSGASGTPAFFINGRRWDGNWTDPDEFVAALTD